MNINRLCHLIGITEQKLYSKKRTQDITRVRFFIWYKLYHQGMTYQAIADMFKKNHSTIINGVRKEQDRRDMRKSIQNKQKYRN